MKEKKEVTYAKNQDLYTRIKKEDCKFIFRKKIYNKKFKQRMPVRR